MTRPLAAGDRLPSERELGEWFGVSRVTVREALKMLEAAGLVTIKVGARGGAFVTAPTSERVGEGISDLLRFSVDDPAMSPRRARSSSSPSCRRSAAGPVRGVPHLGRAGEAQPDDRAGGAQLQRPDAQVPAAGAAG